MITHIIQNYHKNKAAFLLMLLIPLFWFGIRAGWSQTNSDFPNYYVSSKLLLNNKLNEAYDVQLFNEAIQSYNSKARGLFVMYPPTTSLITIYLTPFNLITAKRIWIIMSLLAAAGIVSLMTKLSDLNFINASFVLLLSGFSFYNDIMLGQVYLAMLFLLLLGWHYFNKNKITASGLCWGMLAAFKFLPLFFIPILIYKKQYKLTLVLLSTFILMNVLTIMAGGTEVYKSFINVFSNNYISGKVANDTALSIQYQSMEAFANLLKEKYQWPIFWISGLKLVWKILWIGLFAQLFRHYIKSKYLLIIALTSIILLLLLFENGSASYHLLFCLMALLAAFIIITDKKWKLILIITYATMGFVPFVMSQLQQCNLLLNFSRLWCLSIFALCYLLALKKHQKIIK